MTDNNYSAGLTILLANHDLAYRGGTQAWVSQLYSSLSLDHDVSVFSYGPNTLMAEAQKFMPTRKYDLALINHWPTFQALRRAKIDRRIFTSHGVIPDEEWPPFGADNYVSVSEDVARHIPFPSAIVRNPIDCDRFYPTSHIHTRLRRVAFVSNRQGQARPVVEEACHRMGLELRIVGKETAVSDPENVYNWADCVIGIARTALEAMACNRNVICLDYMGGHGMATPARLSHLRESNYGGHRLAPMWRVNDLIDAFELYDPGLELRPYVLAHHNPDSIAQRYVDIAKNDSPSLPARAASALIRMGPPQLTGVTVSRQVYLTQARVNKWISPKFAPK